MKDETTPEQLERVQRLAEALNAKKRMEDDGSHSMEDRLRADEKVQSALEDVRSRQGEGEESKETNPSSAP